MRTWVAEMLGVELPICTSSHCRDVVACSSIEEQAGGVNVLAPSGTRERAGGPDPFAMPVRGALIGDPHARINRAAGPDSKASGPATYFVGQSGGSLSDAVGRPDGLVDR
jgi:hypothetical protein